MDGHAALLLSSSSANFGGNEAFLDEFITRSTGRMTLGPKRALPARIPRPQTLVRRPEPALPLRNSAVCQGRSGSGGGCSWGWGWLYVQFLVGVISFFSDYLPHYHYSHPLPKLDIRNASRSGILPSWTTAVSCSLLEYDGSK